jgi:hypothetical protein
MEPAGDDLSRALADRVTALPRNGVLVVTELAAEGVSVTTVRRDEAGLPGAQDAPLVPWASLYAGGVLDEEELRRGSFAADGASRVIAYREPGSAESGWALAALRAAYPAAAAFRGKIPAAGLLRRAIADAPLDRPYDLVVLRRTQSGELLLGGCPLFAPGARRGDTAQLTVTFEPSDHRGTVLAVVAREEQRRFQLVSMQAAKITPGTYTLEAELGHPGQVDFHGLPGSLQAEPRTWPELVAMVPRQLRQLAPAHLVVLIESSGRPEQADARAARIRQLVASLAGRRNSELAVSVIAYGPHAVSRGEADEPPRILLWAGRPDAALLALDQPLPRPAGSYARAAQLECALTEVALRLEQRSYGRPVLVVAGSRPAFPPRVDARLGIIPCPRRNDWRVAMERLRGHPGISFGAIHDDPPDGLWEQLGHDALASSRPGDDRAFAVSLGLLSRAAQPLPFPLADAARA